MKIDFAVAGALLKKELRERAFWRGNFDVAGFILRLTLIAVFAGAFVLFFGKFTKLYLSVGGGGRLYELLAISYFLILVSLTVSGVSSVIRALFSGDDLKLLSAMPVGADTLLFAKLLVIWAGQLLFASAAALFVSGTIAAVAPQGRLFWGMTALSCFALPLLSVALSALLAVPGYAVLLFLKNRFALSFVLVTAVTAGGFYAYTRLIAAVKELLLGDDLRYFFTERVLGTIGKVSAGLYPANLLANLITGQRMILSGLLLAGILILCFAVSVLLTRAVLARALKSRIAGPKNFARPARAAGRAHTAFFSLIKREFLQIFRTPAYAFSYFSVALIMPLMVFSCMSVGASLVKRIVGIDCNFELALFLTLLFGALTNVFCSTNISREGHFLAVKALPVSAFQLFFSKILFCMLVGILSQGASALTLYAAGYVGGKNALFLFFAGLTFVFAQVCFATRYDFNHARFSSEEDGAPAESGGAASAVIVLGLISSFLVGGGVVAIKIFSALRTGGYALFPYLFAGGAGALAASGAAFYLTRGLKRKYYLFGGTA